MYTVTLHLSTTPHLILQIDLVVLAFENSFIVGSIPGRRGEITYGGKASVCLHNPHSPKCKHAFVYLHFKCEPLSLTFHSTPSL